MIQNLRSFFYKKKTNWLGFFNEWFFGTKKLIRDSYTKKKDSIFHTNFSKITFFTKILFFYFLKINLTSGFLFSLINWFDFSYTILLIFSKFSPKFVKIFTKFYEFFKNLTFNHRQFPTFLQFLTKNQKFMKKSRFLN